VETITNSPSEDVRSRAKHVLFVEGSADGFDQSILQELLEDRIAVRALGSAFHIENAARAMRSEHPTYYFLIDRDHRSDDQVNKCWGDFCEVGKSNLLIWKRRELENYFVEPDYLRRSQHLKSNADVASEVLKCCQERLYLDLVNYVIVKVREEQKANWIKCVPNLMCNSIEDAVEVLCNMGEFRVRIEKVSDCLSKESLEKMLRDAYVEFTDDRPQLELGHGKWLDLMCGKPVLKEVVNKCCDVRSSKGAALQGDRALREAAKTLIRSGHLPKDFGELRRMIYARVDEN
jgi:hypothetical protein